MRYLIIILCLLAQWGKSQNSIELRWYKSLTCTDYLRVSDAQATLKSKGFARQRRADDGFKSGDLNQLRGQIVESISSPTEVTTDFNTNAE